MASINPIPAGRSSDVLLTRRLLSQLQIEQQRMYVAQRQLATGRRIELPSEDPTASSRAAALQAALESKRQLQTNLSASQSYWSATDTALAGVSDLLANVRGLSVRAVDVTTSEPERQAIAIEVQSTIEQMLQVANQTYQGRYLFAGSLVTERPFETVGDYVVYHGNDQMLRTWADSGLLVDTNVPGQTLFGAVSAEVQGVDLDPVLTPETKAADLRAGAGISPGTILVTDGVHTSTIVIEQFDTLEDIARLIEAHPPEGRQTYVTIGARGLRIELDGLGGPELAVRDVLGGTTAAQLGIARPTLAPGAIDGADLNPVLRSTTRLDDLLGGAAWDRASGLRIDNAGQTYLIDLGTAETVEDLLNAFNSSGAQVVAEINRRGDGINVRSRLSGADFSIGENGGSTATDLGLRSLIAATPLARLNHRQGVDAVAGTDFIIRRRDGVELVVDVSSARTVEDVINLINQHGDNLDPGTAVLARLATVGNGIELVDQNPVAVQPLAVRRVNGSRAAWDLGLVTWGEETSAPADPVSPPGTGERIIGSDVNPLETQGVFNTLIRLHDAILRGDAGEIERVTAMLDDDLDRLSLGRAEVGVRTRSLDALAARNADEQVELQSVLSDTIDVDMAQAVSEFLARQAAYEASLRTMAGMLRMSLLDFL